MVLDICSSGTRIRAGYLVSAKADWLAIGKPSQRLGMNAISHSYSLDEANPQSRRRKNCCSVKSDWEILENVTQKR